MSIPTLDPDQISQKAKQIRAQVPIALTQRGLVPKFTSWRLAQDPSTGLVVLFGILNAAYIAEHTPTSSDAYFDPRLLHDLATDLQVEVIPSNSEGLRYAFVIDRGQLDQPIRRANYSASQPAHLLAEETDSHKPHSVIQDDAG